MTCGFGLVPGSQRSTEQYVELILVLHHDFIRGSRLDLDLKGFFSIVQTARLLCFKSVLLLFLGACLPPGGFPVCEWHP